MANDIITYLDKAGISYERDVELKKRTWIHRGGVAKLWITPSSGDELQEVCAKLYKEHTPFFIIGHTSNIYFSNDYNTDIIISTIKLNSFSQSGGIIVADCGAAVKSLAKYGVEQGLSGFEGLVDLPGTIGAAVYNNSGCYECSVAELLDHIDMIDENGKSVTLTRDDMGYTERSSILKRGEKKGVITKVYLRANPAQDIKAIQQKAETNHHHRITYQEQPAQTLGSVFPTYVVKAFEKNLNAPTRILLSLIYKAHSAGLISFLTRQKAKRDIICVLNGLWTIRQYISERNFNCFIWKDDKADEAFFQYKSKVSQISQKEQTEIEIYQ